MKQRELIRSLECVIEAQDVVSEQVNSRLMTIREAASRAVWMYDRYCSHDLTVDLSDVGAQLVLLKQALIATATCNCTPLPQPD